MDRQGLMIMIVKVVRDAAELPEISWYKNSRANLNLRELLIELESYLDGITGRKPETKDLSGLIRASSLLLDLVTLR